MEKIDANAFAMMQHATADKTAVSLNGSKSRLKSEDLHNTLMAAGFTPVLGNLADAADALLYAAEGEFGNAALSLTAMIPFIGQAVSAKRAIKAAKKAGDEIVAIYRGTNWHPARKKVGESVLDTGEAMVKDGKFVGGKYSRFNPGTSRYDLPEGTIWGSKSKKEAMEWGASQVDDISDNSNYILKFEIPQSELSRLKPVFDRGSTNIGIPGGLDKKWLTKAEKVTEDMYMDLKYGKH